MPTIAIYNPVCGDQTAKSFFEEHVLPLCSSSSKPISSVLSTERIGHSGELVRQELEKTPVNEILTIILGSGDGTLGEIINYLSSAELKGTRAGAPPPEIHLVLVPCGTANALYSSLFPPGDAKASPLDYKLRSTMSFIENSRVVPLTLAITTISTPPTAKLRPKATAATVVASTCLHALILHDSESLRATIPGIDRFKVAAKQNSTKWYNSHAKLLPIASLGVVQLYDPESKIFRDHPDADEDDPIVDLHGPFVYFVSTVNVDRLEPAFRITPLAKDITPSEATCDIVVIRPFEDPTVEMDTPEAREAFVPKVLAVLQEAYNNGNHINLRYNREGGVSMEGDGPFVVEYIRCGGWEWNPDDIDDDAHLVCLDGAISTIEKGGRAVCVAATPQTNAGFMVHV
ncbi:hypothetical protein BT96DRAFT_171137 [Gymnopus androsaceus JB14]|uniref:DAGKc domain-containing protein n=1 Tax=Gymnopus androsaceus JB14 TaxID=1447944 RepID=A0A6A4IAY0_9AGAR|nr:hypothetical protein BT96DRAFT_171137 [Gymnopus androsaceus JB14]